MFSSVTGPATALSHNVGFKIKEEMFSEAYSNELRELA